jgi:hypothetical protein
MFLVEKFSCSVAKRTSVNLIAQKIKISGERTKRSDENCSAAEDADTSRLLGACLETDH